MDFCKFCMILCQAQPRRPVLGTVEWRIEDSSYLEELTLTSWVWDSFFFAICLNDVYKCIKQLHCYCYYSSIIIYYLIYSSYFTTAPRNDAGVEKQAESLTKWGVWLEARISSWVCSQGRHFKQALCMEINNSFRKLGVDHQLSPMAVLDTAVWNPLSEAHQVPSSGLVGLFVLTVKGLIQNLVLLKSFFVFNSLSSFLSISKQKSPSLFYCEELPYSSHHHSIPSEHIFQVQFILLELGWPKLYATLQFKTISPFISAYK